MRENKGTSIIALPSEYVVIDTETTGLDFELCDIIEVCAMRYIDGQCIGSYSSLVKPGISYHYSEDMSELVPYYVGSFITELTGITNEMLTAAPEPATVMPQLRDFIGDTVLLGHNINFDVNFLYDAFEKHCGDGLRNDFIDTMRIARKVFPSLTHHRLSDVAAACNVTQAEAHRAESDCAVTSRCFEVMKEKILIDITIEDFKRLFNAKHANYQASLSNITATVEEIDDTNPIYGKTVVFTGALSCMGRKEALQIVANLGGIPADSITAKTNYLVIGAADFAKSVKDGKTSKMKKAEALRLKGSDIAIISETAFFDLISDYQ